MGTEVCRYLYASTLVHAMLLKLHSPVVSVSAIDCPTETEKFTLKETIQNIDWNGEKETFSSTGFAFLLQSAVAFAFNEEYTAQNSTLRISQDDVEFTDSTARINGCFHVKIAD